MGVMKKLILAILLISFLLTFSCVQKEPSRITSGFTDSTSVKILVEEVASTMVVAADTFYKAEYQAIKQRAIQKRIRWQEEFSQSDTNQQHKILNSVRKYLYQTLTQEVFPAWYGTPWDFNGHVYYPHQGEIACGYFVSTTLKHMGFPLNRYRIAQQDATTIIKLLTPEIKRFRSLPDLLGHLRHVKNKIFIVGLDNHVGFLVTDEQDCWFVHASYGHPAEVVKENAAKSRILSWSSAYILGNLLEDDHLRKHWLEQRPIVLSQ